MQNNVKITEINKRLPLGSKTEIAKRTGLTIQTVQNILKGKNGRMSTIVKVVSTAEDLLKEYRNIIEK